MASTPPRKESRPLPDKGRPASARATAPGTNGIGTVDASQTARPDDRPRLVVACDHRGYGAKCRILHALPKFGYEVTDLGCGGDANCDYPDYAAPAARMVATGEADAAVLLDGSGIGMGIVANKVRGIRAATAHDEVTARIAREYNHCNVLCVGTDLVSDKALLRIVEIFLTTPFAEGRHVRRVAKIDTIELQERHPGVLKMTS